MFFLVVLYLIFHYIYSLILVFIICLCKYLHNKNKCEGLTSGAETQIYFYNTSKTNFTPAATATINSSISTVSTAVGLNATDYGSVFLNKSSDSVLYDDTSATTIDTSSFSKSSNEFGEINTVEITAELTIGKSFFKETYKSFVIYDKSTDSINVTNIGGPLKHFENKWNFRHTGDSSVVDFLVDFELKN